ncbi:hypothetical protein [Desulfoglaeba alkanexedens]|uniref:hypothetical protein n=1 Tax=Desulfoglaeba alkanexedens TaxID=361111 RepID=UPI001476B909|nr:hypothetical protein [Desulfoglaeba alkanexedens]
MIASKRGNRLRLPLRRNSPCPDLRLSRRRVDRHLSAREKQEESLNRDLSG